MLSEDEDRVEDRITVHVEAWQNQRYRPLQGGWGSPLGMAPFTDVDGLVAVPHASVDETVGSRHLYPKSLNLPGWQWTSEWIIDINGTTNDQGWHYGSNFEALVSATKNRLPTGPMKPFSMVRRRRWVRTRVCISEASREFHLTSSRWLTAICGQMARVSLEIDQDCDEILFFERERFKCHCETIIEIDNDLDDTLNMLEGVEGKLLMMIALLVERGKIEAEYARRLEEFSNKWMFTGNPSSSSASGAAAAAAAIAASQEIPRVPAAMQPRSSGDRQLSTGSSPSLLAPFLQVDENRSNVPGGFFYVISQANRSVAQRLQEFASILSSSLPADVSTVLFEVQSVRQDCQEEDGPRLRSNLVRSHETTVADVSAYHTAVQQAVSFIEYNKTLLERKMSCVSATDRHNHRINPVLRRPSHAVLLAESPTLSLSKSSAFSSSSSPRSGSNYAGSDAGSGSGGGGGENQSERLAVSNKTVKIHRDVWLSLQLYNQSVVQWEADLLAYQAFIHQQRKLALLTISRVSSLLQSSVKVFAHEQTRAWTEASESLSAMSAHPEHMQDEDEPEDDEGAMFSQDEVGISLSNIINDDDDDYSHSDPTDATAASTSADANNELAEEPTATVDKRNKNDDDEVNSDEKDNEVTNTISAETTMEQRSRLIVPANNWNATHYIAIAGTVKYALLKRKLSPQRRDSQAINELLRSGMAHNTSVVSVAARLSDPELSFGSIYSESEVVDTMLKPGPELLATLDAPSSSSRSPRSPEVSSIEPSSAAAAISSTTETVAAAADQLEWKEGVVIVTFDSMMHILPSEMVMNGCLVSDKLSSIVSVDVAATRVEPALLPMPGVDGDVIFVHVDPSVSDGKSFLPQQVLSYEHEARDAGADRRRSSVAGLVTSLSMSLAKGLSRGALSERTTHDLMVTHTTIASVALALENSVEASNWMRVISNVFTDLSVDFPEEEAESSPPLGELEL